MKRFVHHMEELPPCYDEGDCVIDTNTRSHCGWCRMEKCRANGMRGKAFLCNCVQVENLSCIAVTDVSPRKRKQKTQTLENIA
jgi:hypothetical protein